MSRGLFLFFAMFTMCFAQAETAEEHLQKLATAVNTSNFKISFVTMQSDSELRSYVWRKSLINGAAVEHLLAQNGPHWEALRVNDTVYHIDDKGTSSAARGQLYQPLPTTLLTAPQQLESAYNFVLLGKSRISGRSATKIRIVSKDNTRFTYTLWVDTETNLMLQLLTHDLQGKLREQLQITSLEMTTQPLPFFEQFELNRFPEMAQSKTANLSPKSSQIDFQWLPVGMAITQRTTKRMAANIGLVQHILVSDGLTDVSVYVKELRATLPKQGGIIVGAENLFTVQKGRFEVTVIGKLPQVSASKLINSMSL